MKNFIRFICVIAFVCAVCMVFSDTSYASTEDSETTLAATKLEVTSITTTKTRSTTCKVRWEVSGEATYYIIFRKTGSGSYKTIGTTKKTAYNDTTIVTGKVYYYKVKAVNETTNKRANSAVTKFDNRSIVSTTHSKYSYKEYTADLTLLEKKYADYCQVNVIGESVDGRNLYEVVLGNPDAEKHMVVIANLHAREYMTTQLCMKQIEYYLENYNKKISGIKISDTFEEICIHYLPSCNPDGTALSQFGISAINTKSLRKALKTMSGISNPSRWKANANGVDLNRNWNYHFKATSSTYKSAGYGGTTAASEPEVYAIVKLLKSIQKNGEILGLVSYHSMGNIIYGRTRTNLDSTVRTQTAKMTSLAVDITGYYLMPTEKDSYTKTNGISNGCSRDYFMYKLGIPTVTIEVGSVACPLPISQFKSIWKKNKTLVLQEASMLLEDSK